MPGEAFCIRFRMVRMAKVDELGRPLSQEKAARLFNVSLSTVRGWEKDRSLPDERSRLRLVDLWPELFQ
jgi:DNA-binding transcriptional regulator YiaG